MFPLSTELVIKFLEVHRVWMYWDIHVNVEDKFLYLAPPVTKEAQHLMSLFGFGKQHVKHVKILF